MAPTSMVPVLVSASARRPVPVGRLTVVHLQVLRPVVFVAAAVRQLWVVMSILGPGPVMTALVPSTVAL